MFRGRFFNVMDDKGRITIPPRYREILKERQEQHLIVTNLDGYLIAFPSIGVGSHRAEIEPAFDSRQKIQILSTGFLSLERLNVHSIARGGFSCLPVYENTPNWIRMWSWRVRCAVLKSGTAELGSGNGADRRYGQRRGTEGIGDLAASRGILHLPVMVQEVLEGLQCQPDRVYVDGTVGLGGHAEAILIKSSPSGRLVGLDQDPANLQKAIARLKPFGSRALLIHSNYSQLTEILEGCQIPCRRRHSAGPGPLHRTAQNFWPRFQFWGR